MNNGFLLEINMYVLIVKDFLRIYPKLKKKSGS